MATLLKTLTADGSNGHHSFKFDIYHIDTDISGNTSYISWNFTISPKVSGWDWSYSNGSPVTYTVTVNGQSWSGKIMSYDGTTADFYIADATRIPVAHTADGSKSISFSFSVSSTSANYLPGSASANGSATLPKIGRASTFSCSTADIESYATITINKQDSSFKHTLKYSSTYGLSGDIIKDTTAASVKWLVPDDFYKKLTDKTSGTVTITCQTIYNGSLIGSTSKDITITTNKAKCQPTLSPEVGCDDATFNLTGSKNVFIKGWSSANYDIGAKAQKSATLLNQRAICGNVSSTDMDGTLYPVETATFLFRAYDSRGYLTEKTINKTLINYIKPTCSVVAENPTATANGKAEMSFTISGQCFSGSFGVVNNQIQVGYRIAENGVAFQGWTEAEIAIDAEKNTYKAIVKVEDLEYKNSYTIKADIHDSITSYVYAKEITVKAAPVFDWSGEDFNFNVPISFNNKPMTDFIEEQGILNDWYYRKWNSGYAECWKTTTVSGINAAEKNYSGFYYSDTQAIDFPFKFVNLPVVQLDGGSSNYVNFVRKFGSHTDKASYIVVGLSSAATNVSINIDIYAFGKWRQ